MNRVPTLLQKGIDDYRAGRMTDALKQLRRFISESPRHPDGYHMLGMTLLAMRKFPEALENISRAAQMAPNIAEYQVNLGRTLTQLGRLEESVNAYRRAVALKPDLAEGHYGLGCALEDGGKLEEGVEAFRAALRCSPGFAPALDGLGSYYQKRNELDEAIKWYRKAITASPRYPSAYNNLGNALRKKGDVTGALAAYEQSLTYGPALFATVWNNIATTLNDAGRIEEAAAAYEKATADLKNPAYFGGKLLAVHFLPDYSAEKIFQEHRRYAAIFAAPLSVEIPKHENTRDPDRRIRVGYLSPDFRKSSVASFLVGFLPHHNSPSVEIYGYNDVICGDAVTQRIKTMSSVWREVGGWTDVQIARQVKDDKIDILVDLAGHTGSNRMLVFARKPAPVQFTYLGYPDTTGLSTIDYRITDSLADPPGMSESFHSERLVRIADSFLCFSPNPDAPPPAPPPALKNGFITFGCCSILAKINDRVLRWWCEILREIPSSRMFLKTRGLQDASTRRRMVDLFIAGGIDESRLDLREPTSSDLEHLATYNGIDIALDTFPYHGTTITCELLWAAVPVVTLAGSTHVSRVGVSLLSGLGLEDWIAQSPEDYVRIAVAKAKDLQALVELRRQLRQRMSASPLTDGCRFAEKLEAIFRQAWKDWRAR